MEKIAAFKFPARRPPSSGFYDVTALPLLWRAEVVSFETKGQLSVVIKSKMTERGKFKRDNHFHVL